MTPNQIETEMLDPHGRRVLEDNDIHAKVQFENDEPPGWFARGDEDGPLELI